MGNALASPCFNLHRHGSRSREIKLIFWEGNTRVLIGRHLAGEIMFEFPDMMVCHADSFFIGRPVPALAIEDVLVPGESYFVLPIDCFPCVGTLSASSLAALGSNSPNNNNGKHSPMKNSFGEGRPFEYLRGEDGRVMIKVAPEFITRLIMKESGEGISSGTTGSSSSPCHGVLCSTPELQKHYSQLVGSNKEQVWSPKLETISEHKLRFSPCRFIGLEWKQKESS
ncbi:uncharacterized protein LOC116212298 [Punica granatum]|uniref:DUF4228 domain-containing protein n=2 Tax=Punica granatum TaxID=22663 RepID=A0A218WA98_PUNGR|nr:uncharacterized protein LOC116212298 [Punica granatum]OWM69141.1 hypothetical protein CDL15_Pgr025328 [Punica granatum]PKI57759.1 hypothetical protein CRG98_021826 [Punica granatum]